MIQETAFAKADIAAAPAGLLHRIDAHIEARLDDPELRPHSAARALGLSVRSLHAALAGTPHSFCQRVARRRLQRAQALLAERSANVADVAFACGFNSLATFYRRYGRVYGVPPGGRTPPVTAATRHAARSSGP